MTTLYSLRTEGSNYRITKFIDGEVESSYLVNEMATECDCPAGHRPSCRHRQMIPNMVASAIVNTHWFWDFDSHRVVDFNGMLKSNLDALNELAARKDDEDVDWDTMAEERMGQRPLSEASERKRQAITDIDGIIKMVPQRPSWRRL